MSNKFISILLIITFSFVVFAVPTNSSADGASYKSNSTISFTKKAGEGNNGDNGNNENNNCDECIPNGDKESSSDVGGKNGQKLPSTSNTVFNTIIVSILLLLLGTFLMRKSVNSN